MPDSLAQHAADNAIVSASDAFGLTLGTETLGLYSADSVRGFNPLAAGNVRIDGLYFDQQGGLSSRVIEGSTIHVALSETGYAFPAPTGIVDYELRRAGGDAPHATIIASAGPFEGRSLSVDGNLALFSHQVELPIGAAYQSSAATPAGPNPGYTSRVLSFGAAPLWTAGDRWSVRGLFDWQRVTGAKTLPTVLTQGDYLPPRIDRSYFGQDWAEGRSVTTNFGGILDGHLTQRWSLRAGIFHSDFLSTASYADLYLDTRPDGLAQHFVLSNPDQQAVSTSGELRLTGSLGGRSHHHELIILTRGRDASVFYGGSDVVGLGAAMLGVRNELPKPHFTYSERATNHTQLWSNGVAYRSLWANSSQLSLGIQRYRYDTLAAAPGGQRSRSSVSPWRGYGNVAAQLLRHLTAYSGYTQGLEDSGTAPDISNNRGEILPAARTWQADAGLRWSFESGLKVIAGVFQITKPYFNLDADNVYRSLGQQSAHGFELSVSGEPLPNFHVIAGLDQGHVVISGAGLTALGVGRAAFGQPSTTVTVNTDYRLPWWTACSLDLGVLHSSAVPASVDDVIVNPAFTELNIGAHYAFRLSGRAASLRLRVDNVTDVHVWKVGYSPGFLQYPPRSLLGQITTDM